MSTDITALPLTPERLGEIRRRHAIVRAAFAPDSLPSSDEATSHRLFQHIVLLLRDDLPLLLAEIERLQADVQLATDLLNWEG